MSMDAEARSKIDILTLKAAQDDRHREDLGRRLYEAEQKIAELEKGVHDLKRDAPNRPELYTAVLAVAAIAIGASIAISLAM